MKVCSIYSDKIVLKITDCYCRTAVMCQTQWDVILTVCDIGSLAHTRPCGLVLNEVQGQ